MLEAHERLVLPVEDLRGEYAVAPNRGGQDLHRDSPFDRSGHIGGTVDAGMRPVAELSGQRPSLIAHRSSRILAPGALILLS